MADTKNLKILIRGTERAGVWYEPQMSAVQNVSTNQSTITITHKISVDSAWGSSYTPYNPTNTYIKIDSGADTAYGLTSFPTISAGSSATVLTTTHTVSHGSDGTKTVTIAFRYNPGGSYSGSGSVTWTLSPIPRVSTMSVSDSYIGGAQSFAISAASTAFYHSVTAKIGSTSLGTIVSKTATRTPSWTVTDLSGYMASNASSVTVTYTLHTFPNSTGTEIGSKDYTAKINLVGKNTSADKSVTIGTANTISVTKNYSSYKTTVQVKFGTSDWITLGTEQSAGTSFAWPTTNWGNYISTAMSAKGTMRVTTYANSTSGYRSIGYNDYVLTVSIPAYNVSASFTVSKIVNDNTTIAGWGVAVKGYTKYQWEVSASTSWGATIEGYSFSVGGKTSSSASGTTGVLTTAGNTTPTMVVTDSRGKTKTISATRVTVYEIGAPTFTSYSAKRTDSGGVAADDGTYLAVNMVGTTAYTCGGHNSVSISWQCTLASGQSVGGDSYAGASKSWLLNILNAEKAYSVLLRVTDKLGLKKDITVSVKSSENSLNIKPGGRGAAFFGYAQTDGVLEVYGGVSASEGWKAEGDNRSNNTSPSDYINSIRWRGIKYNSAIGLSGGGTYSYLIGVRGWTDNSGGRATEFAVNDNGIYIRKANDENSWGTWAKIH